MSSEPKKNTPDDLSKATDVELNEEQLGKVSGGPTAVEYSKSGIIAVL